MKKEKNDLNEEKVVSLQAMIANAEQTILSAKQMLAKLTVNENYNSFKKNNPNANEEGRVIYGNFDGQVMQGEDGKQYPVPANYSSKSKLVEGDVMKLNITSQGSFVYKQVGPIERKYLIGIAKNNDKGMLVINVDDKDYRVLLSAASYFKVEPGDEVTLIVPRDKPAEWGAIENVLRKADEQILEKDFSLENLRRYSQLDQERIEQAKRSELSKSESIQKNNAIEPEEDDTQTQSQPSAIEKLAKEMEEERKKRTYSDDLLDEWTPNIEELRQEIKQTADVKTEN